MIDHDRLFKELLTTFFVEFLDLFLPEVLVYLETDSLEFLDKEVFTDVTAGDRYEADLIVKVKFREQESYFLIHVENQAYKQPDLVSGCFGTFLVCMRNSIYLCIRWFCFLTIPPKRQKQIYIR